MSKNRTVSVDSVTGNLPQEQRVKAMPVLSPYRGVLQETVEVRKMPFVIGRDVDVTLRFADDSVSRRHAQIVVRGEEFFIEDLGSKHGTFVNGLPVISCMLRSGDELQIGRSVFHFDQLRVSQKLDQA